MELAIRKTKNGWKWVVAETNPRSLDCAESFAIANASASLGMTVGGDLVPWIFAIADPEWWKKLRGDPKRLGEISQAAFLLKARQMGFSVAVPWGDSEAQDFIVWAADADGGAWKSTRPTLARCTHADEGVRATQALVRVQVKGTGRLHRGGYEVQPVRTTREGKKRYTKKEIDVIAAHVQPVGAWYLIPIEAVGQAKSLRLYPDIDSKAGKWEEWRERWDVLR